MGTEEWAQRKRAMEDRVADIVSHSARIKLGPKIFMSISANYVHLHIHTILVLYFYAILR